MAAAKPRGEARFNVLRYNYNTKVYGKGKIMSETPSGMQDYASVDKYGTATILFDMTFEDENPQTFDEWDYVAVIYYDVFAPEEKRAMPPETFFDIRDALRRYDELADDESAPRLFVYRRVGLIAPYDPPIMLDGLTVIPPDSDE
ncbi:MAG: hypothetical protein OXN94_00455 [Chloroflexota bacterium]|nr:hypothetical protein [Chloroflexota bacterium]